MLQDKTISDEMEPYIKMGFSNRALNEIYSGLKAGIDVTDFAKREFNELQMRSLRIAKEAGIDITVLLNPEFTHNQMNSLIYGLKRGVDIKDLLNPNISAQTMASEIEDRLIKKKDGIEKPSLKTMLSTSRDKKVQTNTKRKREGQQSKNKPLDIPHR